MAKKISLSSIIKPDESEFISASELDAGLNDAYQPVASGSAMHSRPLPVTMYTYDDDTENEEFDDVPLARAPMRINRRYVPSNKENIPFKTSSERPEFPLFENQKEQKDSGIVYPKSENRFTAVSEYSLEQNQHMIYHNFEDEIMNDFVNADPNVIGLLKKSGLAVPVEVSMSLKMRQKNKNVVSTNTNPVPKDRIKQSQRLYVPDSMKSSDVKKKIQL